MLRWRGSLSQLSEKGDFFPHPNSDRSIQQEKWSSVIYVPFRESGKPKKKRDCKPDER